jgi:hypothetical protein
MHARRMCTTNALCGSKALLWPYLHVRMSSKKHFLAVLLLLLVGG